MPDTVRTVAYLLDNEFQDGQAAGSITPQYVRDLIVSLNALACSTAVVTTYTAAGAISLADSLSIVNSATNVTMTLANGTGTQLLLIKRYGAGSVTITGNIDGNASGSIAMASTGGKESVQLRWVSGLTTWVLG